MRAPARLNVPQSMIAPGAPQLSRRVPRSLAMPAAALPQAITIFSPLAARKMRKESVNCPLRLDSLKCVPYQAAFQNCTEAKCGHPSPVISSKPWSPIRVEGPALQTSYAARPGTRNCSAAGDRLAKKLELLHPEVALPLHIASAKSHDRSRKSNTPFLQDPDCPYQMTHRCN